MTEELMRAMGQNTLGGPEVLHEVRVPRPVPGLSEVLIRVRASGLNPSDWVHRRVPAFLGDVRGDEPRILGWDVSGVVEEVGLGVTLHQPGDQVFGMLPYPQGHGAAAEFVLSPARMVVPKPTGIDHAQAAAVPLTALTAWQALIDTADLREGQRVLVHAAAGGVGHFAVQIAKARGAEVIGTASAAKHDLLRSLGADQVIDYTSTDFAASLKDIDVVIDPIGGDYAPRSLATMRSGGVLVSLALRATRRLTVEAAAIGVRHELLLVEGDHAGMQGIADLIDAGLLRPVIADTFSIWDAAKAHTLGETNRVAGKLVLVH